jgi:hypothetical protein
VKGRKALQFLQHYRFMLDVPGFSREQSTVATQLLDDYEDLAANFKELQGRYPKSDVLWQPHASMAWVQKPGPSAPPSQREEYEMEMTAHKAYIDYGSALTSAAVEFGWPGRALEKLRATQCPLDDNYKRHRTILVQVRDSKPWRNLKQKCEALDRRAEQHKPDF